MIIIITIMNKLDNRNHRKVSTILIIIIINKTISEESESDRCEVGAKIEELR